MIFNFQNNFSYSNVKFLESNFKEQQILIESGFDLILIGLDSEFYYPAELKDNIYNELTNYDLKINKNDINILDEIALISK